MNTASRITRVFAVSLVAGASLLAAAWSRAADSTSLPAAPTFNKDVLPILQRSCQDCHRPGMMAPMSLLTYEEARPWARSIKQQVATRYMPPWHLDRTVGEYHPDPSLSDEEVATVVSWVDRGAPRGNPADAPPPRVFPPANSWQFGEEPDLVIEGPAIPVPAASADLFPEPEVPSGMTEDRYVKWVQVIPEQTRIVHHVLVFAVQRDSANAVILGDERAARAAAAARARAGGARGVTAMLTEYARGNDGDIFKDGEAKLLQAGSTIRFQIHLHPNGEAATEHTRVGIKFFPKGYVPKHLIATKGISSRTSLKIPPMEPNARSDAYFTLVEPARLVSFQPHMHYRGKRMLLEAIPPNGEPELLTDVNRFVWTWQITYPYKDPPTFPRGTVLHTITYHDNSPGNKENPDPTAFIGWGDRTVDEMNIGWLDFYYITDQEYAELQKEKGRAKPASVSGLSQP